MKSIIKTHIVEQPGKIGKNKASELSRKLQKKLSDPEFLALVEKRIAEEKKKTESA